MNEKPKCEKKTIKLTGERKASLIKVPKYKPESKKVDCFNDIKIKGFCTTKDTIDKVKREVAEWKKTFAMPKPNKGLTSSYPRKTNK